VRLDHLLSKERNLTRFSNNYLVLSV